MNEEDLRFYKKYLAGKLFTIDKAERNTIFKLSNPNINDNTTQVMWEHGKSSYTIKAVINYISKGTWILLDERPNKITLSKYLTN